MANTNNANTSGAVPSGPNRRIIRPDSPEQERLKLDVLKRQLALRRQELDHLSILATRTNPKLEKLRADHEKLEWIIGMVEHQNDGSERFFTEGRQALLAHMQGLNLELPRRVEEIKGSLNRDVPALLQLLKTSNDALRDAIEQEHKAGGDRLTKDGSIDKAIDVLKVLPNDNDLLAERNAMVEAGKIIVNGLAKGLTGIKVSDAIESILKDFLTSDELKEVRRLLRERSFIDHKMRDDVLNFLAKAGRIDVINVDVAKDAVTALDQSIGNLEFILEGRHMDKFAARREYNFRFGGSDADAVIGFATAGNRLNFVLLHRQILALAPTSKVTVESLIKESGLTATVDPATQIASFDEKTWKSQPLADFIEREGLRNPAGISFSNMLARSTEGMLILQRADKAISDAHIVKTDTFDIALFRESMKTKAGADILDVATILKIDNKEIIAAAGIDITKKVGATDAYGVEKSWNGKNLAALVQKKLQDFLSSKKDDELVAGFVKPDPAAKADVLDFAGLQDKLDKTSYLGLSVEVLKMASGLPHDAKVPNGWLTRNILSDFIRMKRVERLTGVKSEDIKLPLDERIKEYAKSFAGTAGKAATTWGAWIATLPQNVYEKDDEYNKLLKQKDALNDAKKVIVRFSKEWPDRSETSLLSAFDDLKTMQEQLDKAVEPVSPARDVTQKVDQFTKLMKVSDFVLDALTKENTGFNYQRDPLVRRTAFFIAMEYGIPAAQEYLASPTTYLQQHGEHEAAILKYNENVRRGEVTAGRDNLEGMKQTFGVRVHPAALQLLADTDGPDGKPLSIGATRIDNWLTDPSKAGPALALILEPDLSQPDLFRTDPKTGEKVHIGKAGLIQAFTTQVDIPGFYKVADANDAVSKLRDHLITQTEDMQRNVNQVNAETRVGDPLNMLRGGIDAVIEMLDGDAVEKTLGIGLIVGSFYAVYRGWKRGGLTKAAIVALPMFFGADIALKKATGKGILDRLDLNYMNEQDRNSSYEQFVRRAAASDARYAFLKDDSGREAMKQLMDPDKNISIEELLNWRDNVRATGGQSLSLYAQGAPSQLAPALVSSKIGLVSAHGYPGAELRGMAYEHFYLAFDAFCADIARANGLGGDSIHEQAQLGAKLLRSRYVDFNEPYMLELGDAFLPAYKTACKKERFTVRHIMTYERRTPGVMNSLENASWTEWMAAKIGVPFAFASQKIKEGYTWAEVQFLYAKEQAPGFLHNGKKVLSSSFESFMNWFSPTFDKTKREVLEDLRATWNFVSGTCKEFGLLVVEKGPGVLEWTFDKTVDLTKFTKRKALDIYNELHHHQVVGNMMEGFEDFFGLLFGQSVQDADIEVLSEPEKVKEDLVHMLDKGAQPPVGTKLEDIVEGWLQKLGTTKADKVDGKLVGDKTPAERMLLYEVLKRDIFSYMAAVRIHHIKDDKYKKGEKLAVTWPSDIEITDQGVLKLTDTQNTEYGDMYRYIRSRYTTGDILSLIGRENVIPDGWLKDFAEKYPDGYTGQTVGVTHFLIDWITRSESTEYLQNDLKVYKAELDKEAESLTPKEQEDYRAYVDTLLLNVLMESTLADKGPEPADLKLTIAQAKRYLYNLRSTRGNTPKDGFMKKNVEKLKIFKLSDEQEPPMLAQLIVDPKKKWILAGKDPPEDAKPAEVSGGGGAAAAAAPKKEVFKATPVDTVEALGKLTKEAIVKNTKGEQKSLLDGIKGTLGDTQLKLREKFDEAYDIDPATYKNDAGQDALHNYLRGVTDVKLPEAEKWILKDVKDPGQLQPLMDLRASDIPSADRARVQRVLDLAVVKLLQPIVDEIAATDVNDRAGKKLEWQKQLMDLYKASGSKPATLLPDTVSIALEFLSTDGNYGAKTITQYNEELAGIGAPPISTDSATKTWWQYLGRKGQKATIGIDYVASERFYNKLKLTADAVKKAVAGRLKTAKSQLGE